MTSPRYSSPTSPCEAIPAPVTNRAIASILPRDLVQPVAAVDVDCLAGDGARGGTHEGRDPLDDALGLAAPSDCLAGDDLVEQLTGRILDLCALGGDEPWCNAVHGDSVDPRFIGQSSGEPDQPAFTG